MATTPPELVRKALAAVTGAAQAEFRAVAQAASDDPQEWRAALFAAAPLIVSEYSPATAALALDWFEEIRADSGPRRPYVPTPRLLVSDEDVAQMIASTTEALLDIEKQIQADVEQILAEAQAAAEAALQRQVAAGFRDTMTGNTDDDPDTVGWRRFARDGGCKFCLMLADRGAVFTETSVRFAAHKNCGCVVGQSYDPDAPRADVMQYVASRRNRSDEDRARLRAYLNENFPDAPG